MNQNDIHKLIEKQRAYFYPLPYFTTCRDTSTM